MMRCTSCQAEITRCVKLSEYTRLCEDCYASMVSAWQAEQVRGWGNCPTYLPSPDELAERIAEVRRELGTKPRNIDEPSLRGTVLYVPKKVAYRSHRRGAEVRGE